MDGQDRQDFAQLIGKLGRRAIIAIGELYPLFPAHSCLTIFFIRVGELHAAQAGINQFLGVAQVCIGDFLRCNQVTSAPLFHCLANQPFHNLGRAALQPTNLICEGLPPTDPRLSGRKPQSRTGLRAFRRTGRGSRPAPGPLCRVRPPSSISVMYWVNWSVRSSTPSAGSTRPSTWGSSPLVWWSVAIRGLRSCWA